MIITYDLNLQRYVCIAEYEWRHIPKQFKFLWDAQRKEWWSNDPFIVARLSPYCDFYAQQALSSMYQQLNQRVYNSISDSTTKEYPCNAGRSYMPYQRAGIQYLIDKKCAILGDEMGLGKTAQVIGVINELQLKKVLIVCPSYLKLNWKRELEAWLVPELFLTIGVTKSNKYPDADIVISNYEQLWKHPRVFEEKWDMIVGDEAHYIKNPKAKRTKTFKKLQSERRVLLTGTPVKNTVGDVWSLANWIAPDCWPNKFLFDRQFLALDKKTPINTEELNIRLRSTVMIRRIKKDVLADLPRKTRQVIELPADGIKQDVKAEKEAYLKAIDIRNQIVLLTKNAEDYKDRLEELKSAKEEAVEDWKKKRKEVGLAKVDTVVKYAEDALEQADKIVLFCYHHDVISAYAEYFQERCELHYGALSNEEREYSINRFQTDPKCKVLIAGISTAMGYTATAASIGIFAEFSWIPSDMSQAEDRLHRIGQVNPVTIQHLVLEGSVDFDLVKKVIEKQIVADKSTSTML